ncbi:MAG TPA: choice-of-anchor Q domain-containing protein [Chloroflexota bacterium]|nr:choice-of-anchor Q domain-containing protein [Chloroflexota bacterium]
MNALQPRLLGAALLALAATMGSPAMPVLAATFFVNSTIDAVDANPGDGICATAGRQCTLRAAVMEANALAGPDTIRVPAGVYALSIPTTPQEDDASPIGQAIDASGDLDITDDLTLGGVNAKDVVVDANGISRAFDVHVGSGKDASGLDVSISALTIREGKVIQGVGGGIRNVGALRLAGVVVTENGAYNGGGIANSGDLKIDRSTIHKNVAEGAGGGIANWGPLDVNASTLSSNQATGSQYSDHGGALFNGVSGSALLTNVTISGNAAEVGGGISTITNVTLRNVTFGGNAASGGAGGQAGGGIHIGNPGIVSVKHTIFADSPSGGNCDGFAVTSNGYNVDDGMTCGLAGPGDLNNTDPALGPLKDNGGPTHTQALSPGSKAIDAGTSAGCPATDQRGVARPLDGDGSGGAACDIGAYEAAGPAIKIEDIPPVGCPPFCPPDPRGGPVINPPVEKPAPIGPMPLVASPTPTPRSSR